MGVERRVRLGVIERVFVAGFEEPLRENPGVVFGFADTHAVIGVRYYEALDEVFACTINHWSGERARGYRRWRMGEWGNGERRTLIGEIVVVKEVRPVYFSFADDTVDVCWFAPG